MEKIRIGGLVSLEEVVDSLTDQLSHEELYEFITMLDKEVAEWDFSMKLGNYFVKELAKERLTEECRWCKYAWGTFVKRRGELNAYILQCRFHEKEEDWVETEDWYHCRKFVRKGSVIEDLVEIKEG